MARFEPLVRCDGPDWCGALVEPHAARCAYCARRHGPSPNATGTRGHAAPLAKVKLKSKPALAPCCGIDGTGCRDGALVHRDGKRKRCQRCELRFQQSKQRNQPTGSMPFHLWQAQVRREAERDRAARRPVKGGGVR